MNNPDVFCYICGYYTLVDNKLKIYDLVKTFYVGIFSRGTWWSGQIMGTSHSMLTLQKGVATVGLGINKIFEFWRTSGLEGAKKSLWWILLFLCQCKRGKS